MKLFSRIVIDACMCMYIYIYLSRVYDRITVARDRYFIYFDRDNGCDAAMRTMVGNL